MQLTIAICDDDKTWICQARKVLETYETEKGITLDILEYQDSRSLLEASALIRPDIIFVDAVQEKLGEIDSSETVKADAPDPEDDEEDIVKNGIELARLFNVKWPFAQTVYLTDYLYYASEIYDTRHTYYVLKNQFEDRIERIIRKAVEQINYFQMKVHFSLLHEGDVILRVADIVCFERNLRKTIIHLAGENDNASGGKRYAQTYVIKDRINDVEAVLPQGEFLRCHNSYIANLSHIKVFHRDEIILDNDRELPISRAYQKRAREQLTAWIEARGF